MATTSQVANLAAAKIGTETRITSLDDDRSVARTLKSVWDIERRATIRGGAWNFAARRAELAAMTPAALAAAGVSSIYPYGYAFPLPSDALRLIEVTSPISREAYQLEGGRILCDEAGPLYIRYLADVAEPAAWDDAFAEAFACRLAWKCGKRIAGSSYDEQLGWKEYEAAIGSAGGIDAKENPPLRQEESDWIVARWGSYAWQRNPAWE